MSESRLYRIRIKLDNKQEVFFVNAMSPKHALAKDPQHAQRFHNEVVTLGFLQSIIDGGRNGYGVSGGQYFTRLKQEIFTLASQASVHIDSARLTQDGSAGVWSELPKGGMKLNNINNETGSSSKSA